jgi:uncharacterized protein
VLKLGIANLSEGVTVHIIEVMPSQLELDQCPEFSAPIHAKFSLSTVSGVVYVKANLSAECEFVCDRCLETFTAVVSDTIRMIFTSSSELDSEGDDYVFNIGPSDSEIDVTHPVKETLLLALPFKRICSKDCKGLCPQCGENLNVTSCDCSQNVIDPRWDALKKMINN